MTNTKVALAAIARFARENEFLMAILLTVLVVVGVPLLAEFLAL